MTQVTSANLASVPASSAGWYHQPSDHVLAAFQSHADHGLTHAEAGTRLLHHGPNSLPVAKAWHPLMRFLAQFHSVLIYFLLAGALAALFLGHLVDAAVIVAVVTVNAIVGFIQEGRAEQALEAIRDLIAPHASVLREGVRTHIPVAELVPGDVVLVEAGDRVPADLRLLRAHGLRIDEAMLTGESVAAEKTDTPAFSDAALGDRHCMAYSGTLVTAGQGIGIVVATGHHTEIGRISGLLGSVETLTTPLLRQVNRFGRRFTGLAIAVAAVLFVFAIVVHGYGWTDALMVTLALAVSVVPEGLPAVITITLAIGVRRMAARHAIIRRLPAVETLGATSVICSDKTGTLTRNEMTVRRLFTHEGEFLAEGSGYTPEGRLLPVESAVPDAVLAQLLRCGLLCNDARLHDSDGTWRVEGDPMEGALLAVAGKGGLMAEAATWSQRDVIPFDARHRFMATLHCRQDGECQVLLKGAPEQVLALCEREMTAQGNAPLDREAWEQRIAQAANAGERVLAFAGRPATGAEKLSFEKVGDGLVLYGLVGFIDPPRDEVIQAVAECRSAGIAVKMITGDHAATAAAIARQIGLAENPVVVTGAELDATPDEAFAELTARTTVFARTSPEHKLRVVQALQKRGAVVAMTGDGVNDAPSLKQADVGIAMGRKGTEAAKEASEVVLTDDNFAAIVAAVHEGRVVYDNIRKVMAWTLPTNGGEVLAVIAALLFGLTLPMNPAQILWVNLILTATLGLVLAFEPAEPGVMQRPPRPFDEGLLTPFMLWRVVFVSLLFMAGALGIFSYATVFRGLEVEAGRTFVVNTLVVLEIFYLFNVRYLHMRSLTWKGAMGTPAVLAAIAVVVLAQLLFTYAPFMQVLFETRPVAIADGIVIIATGVLLMLVLEVEKNVLRRFGWLGQGVA